MFAKKFNIENFNEDTDEKNLYEKTASFIFENLKEQIKEVKTNTVKEEQRLKLQSDENKNSINSSAEHNVSEIQSDTKKISKGPSKKSGVRKVNAFEQHAEKAQLNIMNNIKANYLNDDLLQIKESVENESESSHGNTIVDMEINNKSIQPILPQSPSGRNIMNLQKQNPIASNSGSPRHDSTNRSRRMTLSPEIIKTQDRRFSVIDQQKIAGNEIKLNFDGLDSEVTPPFKIEGGMTPKKIVGGVTPKKNVSGVTPKKSIFGLEQIKSVCSVRPSIVLLSAHGEDITEEDAEEGDKGEPKKMFDDNLIFQLINKSENHEFIQPILKKEYPELVEAMDQKILERRDNLEKEELFIKLQDQEYMHNRVLEQENLLNEPENNQIYNPEYDIHYLLDKINLMSGQSRREIFNQVQNLFESENEKIWKENQIDSINTKDIKLYVENPMTLTNDRINGLKLNRKPEDFFRSFFNTVKMIHEDNLQQNSINENKKNYNVFDNSSDEVSDIDLTKKNTQTITPVQEKSYGDKSNTDINPENLFLNLNMITEKNKSTKKIKDTSSKNLQKNTEENDHDFLDNKKPAETKTDDIKSNNDTEMKKVIFENFDSTPKNLTTEIYNTTTLSNIQTKSAKSIPKQNLETSSIKNTTYTHHQNVQVKIKENPVYRSLANRINFVQKKALQRKLGLNTTMPEIQINKTTIKKNALENNDKNVSNNDQQNVPNSDQFDNAKNKTAGHLSQHDTSTRYLSSKQKLKSALSNAENETSKIDNTQNPKGSLESDEIMAEKANSQSPLKNDEIMVDKRFKRSNNGPLKNDEMIVEKGYKLSNNVGRILMRKQYDRQNTIIYSENISENNPDELNNSDKPFKFDTYQKNPENKSELEFSELQNMIMNSFKQKYKCMEPPRQPRKRRKDQGYLDGIIADTSLPQINNNPKRNDTRSALLIHNVDQVVTNKNPDTSLNMNLNSRNELASSDTYIEKSFITQNQSQIDNTNSGVNESSLNPLPNSSMANNVNASDELHIDGSMSSNRSNVLYRKLAFFKNINEKYKIAKGKVQTPHERNLSNELPQLEKRRKNISLDGKGIGSNIRLNRKLKNGNKHEISYDERLQNFDVKYSLKTKKRHVSSKNAKGLMWIKKLYNAGLYDIHPIKQIPYLKVLPKEETPLISTETIKTESYDNLDRILNYDYKNLYNKFDSEDANFDVAFEKERSNSFFFPKKNK